MTPSFNFEKSQRTYYSQYFLKLVLYKSCVLLAIIRLLSLKREKKKCLLFSLLINTFFFVLEDKVNVLLFSSGLINCFHEYFLLSSPELRQALK